MSVKNLRWPIFVLIPLVVVSLVFWELGNDSSDNDVSDSNTSENNIGEEGSYLAQDRSWFCPVLDSDFKLEVFNPEPQAIELHLTIFSSVFEQSNAPISSSAASSVVDGSKTNEASEPYITGTFEISLPALENQIIDVGELFVGEVEQSQPEKLPQVMERIASSAVFISALVEFSSSGPIPDVSLCTTQASSSWYIPFASTTRDACYYLAVFNPFSAPAVLDLEFATDDGIRSPYEGEVVQAGTLKVLNIGTKVTRRDHISTNLSTRTGRVIAAKLLTFTGKPDSLERFCPEAPYEFFVGEELKLWGSQIVVGAPTAEKTWYFPAGINPLAGGSYVVYNPDPDSPIEVDLRLIPNLGTSVLQSFSVPPRQRVAVQITEGELHPLPSFPAPIPPPGFESPETGHWAIFESESEIVVERLQTGPQIREGIIGGLGITSPATQLPIHKNLLNFGTESGQATYVIANPSSQTIARIEIPGVISGVEIGPRRRFSLNVLETLLVGDEVLTSTTPVVAEPRL